MLAEGHGMENHTLYYRSKCPFCQKVLRFMDDNKITMDATTSLQPAGDQNDLVRIGGKKRGSASSSTLCKTSSEESDDIIAYLLRSTNA